MRLTVLLCALLVAPGVSWAQSDAELIAEATVSLSEDEGEGAAVAVVDADGNQRVLRGSTNGLLCRLHRDTGFSFTECYEAETHQLFVSAVNRGNEPVRDLRVDEVRLERAGAVCTVVSVTRATDPMKVALLVDNSAEATLALNPLRRGLRNFLDTLPAFHEVGLFTISGQVRQRVEFTIDRNKLQEQVSRLFIDRSGAELIDGLFETWDRRFDDEDAWPVFVLVLTDSRPDLLLPDVEAEVNRMLPPAYDAFVGELQDRAATVHAVVLSPGRLGVKSTLSGHLTQNTGGVFLRPVAIIAMAEHYDDVTRRYRVVYECEPDNSDVAMTVTVTRPDLTFRPFLDRRRSSPNGAERR